jgi:hypothetical protein
MEKIFTGYVILNWKTGKFSVRKTQPKKSSLNPFEIPIKLDIRVLLPEKKELVAKGEIILPEEKVKEMVISEI